MRDLFIEFANESHLQAQYQRQATQSLDDCDSPTMSEETEYQHAPLSFKPQAMGVDEEPVSSSLKRPRIDVCSLQ